MKEKYYPILQQDRTQCAESDEAGAHLSYSLGGHDPVLVILVLIWTLRYEGWEWNPSDSVGACTATTHNIQAGAKLKTYTQINKYSNTQVWLFSLYLKPFFWGGGGGGGGLKLK